MASAMTVLLRICRRLHPRLYIRIEIARVERQEKAIRHVWTIPAEERQERLGQLDNELQELYEWQQQFKDDALIRRAAKIGVYLDEIAFPVVDDRGNIGLYHRIGQFGDRLLRDEFRTPLLKAVREREPSYRKEQREQIELVVKIIAALTAASTGIIGALIGLFAIRK